MTPQSASYFRRFGLYPRQIDSPPHPELKLVIVIPCFNEPNLTGTLSSLQECAPTRHAVEVMVVINAGEGAAAEVLQRNQKTHEEALAWCHVHSTPRRAFHVLLFPSLPARQAGVGLARKIGMDEALRRLEQAGHLESGVIVGLDADCKCAPNYLGALEEHFETQCETPGGSLHFEHPLAGVETPAICQAAAAYELHLRYYVQALRYARFPHAFHTVGSCMAVRARVYMEQGGMNKRQAGEDFYFLHKIIALGGFTEISNTTVYPSPRLSERVPFGTGKAVGEYLKKGKQLTYPLEAFLELRKLLEALPTRAWKGSLASNRPHPGLSAAAQAFLEQQQFTAVMDEIQRNTATPASFQKRFFRWFDGFMAMKFVHCLRDYYGERRIDDEAKRLLHLMRVDEPGEMTCSLRDGASGEPVSGTTALLRRYRQLALSAPGLAATTTEAHLV